MSTVAAEPSRAAPTGGAAAGVGRAPAPVLLQALTKRFPVRRGWGDAVRRPFHVERRVVVDGVTAEIQAGEFFGLLGPNGAGKTTLFKMLATLVIPDAGTATIAGLDVVREGPGVRRLLTPVIADERSLYWRLSARENLQLFARLHGFGGADADRRVEEVLHAVSLADTGTRLAGEFSSGMKQRLLIARALLSRPSVLLLDEPTRSLDPVSARAFRHFLREEVSRKQGCTVLLATHNAEEALELCDRVGVLDRGRLLAAGRADDLAARFGEEQYRVWTRDPEHPTWSALVARGLIRQPTSAGAGADGWTRVEMAIPGPLDRAAAVVEALAGAGVSVGRFERVGLSLADLIERIVQRHGGGGQG
jgi:ABC-type multidrug transport system ATPase subunit